jgi:WD40 repeat protein
LLLAKEIAMLQKDTVVLVIVALLCTIVGCAKDAVKQVAHSAEIGAMCFSPDGKMLITGDKVGTIRGWRTDDWKLSYEMKSCNGSIHSLDVSADNMLLSVGTWKAVELWELQTHTIKHTFPEKETTKVFFARLPPRSIGSWGPDRRQPPNELLAWRYGELWKWDASTCELKNKSNAWEQGSTHSHDVIAICSNDYPLFVYGEGSLFSGFLIISNLESGERWKLLDCTSFKEGPVIAAFPSSGSLVAAGFLDGSIGVWSVSSGELLHTMKKHKGWVTAIAFLGEDILLSGDNEGWIYAWDTDQGKFTKSYHLTELPARAIVVSDDGRRLAVGYGIEGTGRIFVIDDGLKNFRELRTSVEWKGIEGQKY